MTSSTSHVPIDDYVVDYADRLLREVIRVVTAVRRGFDADDIASNVVEEFLRRPDVIMMKYPDPARFARQRTRHAGISHDRRERAQRAEGVRLTITDDGRVLLGTLASASNPTMTWVTLSLPATAVAAAFR